ncbi:MAG: hypothetical protein HFG41_08105 [Coprococcus sp.]|nr:hypothetical protein [Coprococcus sp.]
MTVTDVRHDHVDVYHSSSKEADLEKVNEVINAMEEKARKELEEEGFSDSSIYIDRFVDARYQGQIHELTVSVPEDGTVTQDTVVKIVQNFHKEHEAQFGYCREQLPLEFLHWRVTAMGRQSEESGYGSHEIIKDAVPRKMHRTYDSDRKAFIDTALYNVEDVTVGCRVAGPAVIASPTTTIILHPGDTLSRHSEHGFLVDIADGRNHELSEE